MCSKTTVFVSDGSVKESERKMLKDVVVKSKMLTAEKFDSEFKKFDQKKEAEYKIHGLKSDENGTPIFDQDLKIIVVVDFNGNHFETFVYYLLVFYCYNFILIL